MPPILTRDWVGLGVGENHLIEADSTVFEAGAFGGEDDSVGSEGFVGSRLDSAGVILADGSYEVADEAVIAAAVATFGFGNVEPAVAVSGPELPHVDLVLVDFDFEVTLGSVNADVTASPGGEGGHGEGGGDTFGKLEGDDLVVHHVIVGVVDASAVAAGGEGFADLSIGEVGESGAVSPSAVGSVDFDGVVGADVLGGAAFNTVVGCAKGGVFGSEVLEGAEGVDLLAGFINEPGDGVDIVAAFGEEHEGTGLLPAPVASDEGVGLVDVLNGFELVEGDDFADLA